MTISPEKQSIPVARLSIMGRLRERLHPQRRYLKWLRHLARWQMQARLPITPITRRRFMYWVNALTLDPAEEVDWKLPGTDLHFMLDLSEEIQSDMFYIGAFQPEVFCIFSQYLKTNGIFVDVGAHVGQYTLWAADRLRRLQPGIAPCVVAFEPNPGIFRSLQRNVRLNGMEAYVHLCSLAVSDRPGIVPFFPGTATQSGGSALALHTQSSHFAQAGEAINVQSVTLDAFFQQHVPVAPISMIKLDIEGAELLALQGAAQTLAAHRPVLILEAYAGFMQSFGYTYQQLRDFLRALHYTIYHINADATLVAETTGDIAEAQFHDFICLPM